MGSCLSKQTFWSWLIKKLQSNETVALLLVVASQGSSPGKAGAKMAVTPEGITRGTIGGGKMEFALTEQAMTWLKAKQPSIQLYLQQHHSPLAKQASGQICGGCQTIVYLHCTQQHLPLLQQFERAYLQKQPCLLQLSPQGLTCTEAKDTLTRPNFTFHGDRDWLYQENIGLRKTAYLIGGGHVSLALTKILVLLEFDVVVIDQRENVTTMQENHLATQKRILSYSRIRDAIQEGAQSYVLVMTHSHETDQQIIANLADIQVGYFGVLGSRQKLKVLQHNLSNRVSRDFWNSLHAPAGLAINSSTPMEIAISITAELIRLANTPESS